MGGRGETYKETQEEQPEIEIHENGEGESISRKEGGVKCCLNRKKHENWKVCDKDNIFQTLNQCMRFVLHKSCPL